MHTKKLLTLVFLLVVVMTTSSPTSTQAGLLTRPVASSQTVPALSHDVDGAAHRTKISGSIPPLPHDCDGVTPPNTPNACCIWGYVYGPYDIPVEADVYIESAYGSLSILASGGSASPDFYYSEDLQAVPLSTSVGDLITITVAYDDMISMRTWTVLSSSQQVDLGLVIGYQAVEPIPTVP